MKSAVLSTLGVSLLVASFAPAHAERVSPCKTIRAEGAAFLQLCGGARLRSFALSMQGTERTAVLEHTNKFKFSCRPGFCQGEPAISGWFIDSKVWTRGKQDEPAIFDILATEAGWKLLGSEQHFRGIFKPSCELSHVTVAGLSGQMICYNTESPTAEGPATVVMIAADDWAGFVLLFQSPDSKNVVDHAVSALRAFSLERGEGDVTLKRWLQQ
jgi:hypothetical protein